MGWIKSLLLCVAVVVIMGLAYYKSVQVIQDTISVQGYGILSVSQEIRLEVNK